MEGLSVQNSNALVRHRWRFRSGAIDSVDDQRPKGPSRAKGRARASGVLIHAEAPPTAIFLGGIHLYSALDQWERWLF